MSKTYTMKKGFLAFIDILGFREGIQNPESMEYVNLYFNIINNIVSEIQIKYADKIDITANSDSLILTSVEPTILLKTCSELFFELICNDLPIRGAISYGLFKRGHIGHNIKNVIIAGPALIEAYKYEQAQNWIGMILTPSANNKLFKFLNQWTWLPPSNELATCIYNYKIPMRSHSPKGNYVNGFAIYPKKPNKSKFQDEIFTLNIKKFKMSTFSSDIQKKYENTLKYFKEIHSFFNFYGNDFAQISKNQIENIHRRLQGNDQSEHSKIITEWYKEILNKKT